jgi:hypothetical protein
MEKKRKVRANIPGVDTITHEDLKKSVVLRDLVVKETPNAIEEAINNRNNFASLFEVNESGNCVEIHRRDWIPALESCMIHCVQKEDYEACSKINKLIDKLKLVNSAIKIKKTNE